MSTQAIHHPDVALTSAPALTSPSIHGVPAWLRDTVVAGEDVLLLGLVVFCIPFVILGIGIPIAAVVQLLLWIGRLL